MKKKVVQFSLTYEEHQLLSFEAESKGLMLSAYSKMSVFAYAHKYPARGPTIDAAREGLRQKVVTKEKIEELRKSVPAPYWGGSCVYLLYTNNDRSLFKIGCSSNVGQRIKDIQEQANVDVDVVFSISVKDKLKVERKLHDHFSALRVHGEWFAMRETDVRSFPGLVRVFNRQ